MFDPDVHYSQEEMAAKLGKSVAWAARARWAGTGPKYLKIGKSVRYRGADVLAWLEGNTRTSTSDK